MIGKIVLTMLVAAAKITCDAPRKEEMETKYTGEWLEKRRAKPMCFVSRNQKRPGRHLYCFLETKHAQNPGLFPMFPFSCVSTSTLMGDGMGDDGSAPTCPDMIY